MACPRPTCGWTVALCVLVAAPLFVAASLQHPVWLARAAPAWEPRFGACAVALNNETYVIGGAGIFAFPGPSSAVWKSSDMEAWVQVQPFSRWAARESAACVAHQGSIYLIGGKNDRLVQRDLYFDDVWASTTGGSWKPMTVRAPWGGRVTQAVSFGGGLWVVGGTTGANASVADVWRSSDGATWEAVTLTPPWPPRTGYRVAVFGSHMVLAGGYSATAGALRSLWVSEDGETWTTATPPPFLPRSDFAFATALLPARVVNDTSVARVDGAKPGVLYHLIAAGGAERPSGACSVPTCQCFNDVWATTDLVTWTSQASQGIAVPWTPRSRVATCVFAGELQMVGGMEQCQPQLPLAEVWDMNVEAHPRAQPGSPDKLPWLYPCIAFVCVLALAIGSWCSRRAYLYARRRKRILDGREELFASLLHAKEPLRQPELQKSGGFLVHTLPDGDYSMRMGSTDHTAPADRTAALNALHASAASFRARRTEGTVEAGVSGSVRVPVGSSANAARRARWSAQYGATDPAGGVSGTPAREPTAEPPSGSHQGVKASRRAVLSRGRAMKRRQDSIRLYQELLTSSDFVASSTRQDIMTGSGAGAGRPPVAEGAEYATVPAGRFAGSIPEPHVDTREYGAIVAQSSFTSGVPSEYGTVVSDASFDISRRSLVVSVDGAGGSGGADTSTSDDSDGDALGPDAGFSNGLLDSTVTPLVTPRFRPRPIHRPSSGTPLPGPAAQETSAASSDGDSGSDSDSGSGDPAPAATVAQGIQIGSHHDSARSRTSDSGARRSSLLSARRRAPGQSLSIRVIDFNELEVEPTPVGGGNFGSVYKGRFRSAPVAVKKLYQHDGRTEMDFMAEAAVFQHVSGHPHIIQFYGVCVDPGMCLITEFAVNGSLERLLVHSQRKVALIDVVRFAQEASSGLLHLHREQVCHRDVATRNLLLNEAWHVKVCDFGMSRAVLPGTPEEHQPGARRVRMGRGGPLRWMAPESLRPLPNAPRFSERSDVYMLGITMWEMLLRKMPYERLMAHEAALRVCTEGLRPTIPAKMRASKQLSPFIDVMVACWAQDPADRPPMAEVVERLTAYHRQLVQEQRAASAAGAGAGADALAASFAGASRVTSDGSTAAAGGSSSTGPTSAAAAAPVGLVSRLLRRASSAGSQHK